MIKLFCSFVIIVSGGSSSIHISLTHPFAHRCGYRLERKGIDHTMTETTEKMQFLILGNIPENVNLIYTARFVVGQNLYIYKQSRKSAATDWTRAITDWYDEVALFGKERVKPFRFSTDVGN